MAFLRDKFIGPSLLRDDKWNDGWDACNGRSRPTKDKETATVLWSSIVAILNIKRVLAPNALKVINSIVLELGHKSTPLPPLWQLIVLRAYQVSPLGHLYWSWGWEVSNFEFRINVERIAK